MVLPSLLQNSEQDVWKHDPMRYEWWEMWSFKTVTEGIGSKKYKKC